MFAAHARIRTLSCSLKINSESYSTYEQEEDIVMLFRILFHAKVHGREVVALLQLRHSILMNHVLQCISFSEEKKV